MCASKQNPREPAFSTTAFLQCLLFWFILLKHTEMRLPLWLCDGLTSAHACFSPVEEPRTGHSTSRGVSPALSREVGSWSDGSTPPDEAQECCWLSWQQGHNAVSYSVHWPQVPFLFYKMWFILGMGKIVQISPHSTHFKTHCRHSKFRVSLYETVQNELLTLHHLVS